MKEIIFLMLVMVSIPANADFNKADLAYLGFVGAGYAATQIKETDKASHYFAGMAVGGFVTAASNPYYGIASAGIVGGLKEAYDRRSEGHVASWPDWGYTLAGGVIASGLVYLLQDYDKSVQIYEYKDPLQRKSVRIGYSKQF